MPPSGPIALSQPSAGRRHLPRPVGAKVPDADDVVFHIALPQFLAVGPDSDPVTAAPDLLLSFAQLGRDAVDDLVAQMHRDIGQARDLLVLP